MNTDTRTAAVHSAAGADTRSAELYRMVTPDHICPFGLKASSLLKRKGFKVEDHSLRTREEADQFKSKHDVETTPQIFIAGKRIGGYDQLREHLGLAPAEKEGVTYTPVLVVFGVAALMALALTIGLADGAQPIRLIEWFAAFSVGMLALLKLRDVEAFTNQFLGYDLLAQRFVPYAYVYPFAEAFVALGMLAQIAPFLVGSVAIAIGGVGAVSVFKAVYIDKRELKCACVGGNSNVPLGLVSLSENVTMVLMGIWMMAKVG